MDTGASRGDSKARWKSCAWRAAGREAPSVRRCRMLKAMESTCLLRLVRDFVPVEDLDETLVQAIAAHLALLERWNQKMNLTAVRSAEQMVTRHFGESLFAARQLLSRQDSCSILDLGSGAGFPGLPLKYWASTASLTLVEGHGKKATFLREVCRVNQLHGVEVVEQRAESLSRQANLVTMRAVEQFAAMLPVAIQFVAPGGRLALWLGTAQQAQIVDLLGAGTVHTIPLPEARQRILLVWQRPVEP